MFTPEDSELWAMARHVVQGVDYAQNQIVEHLYKLHMFMEPVCVCMHRNLAKLHPLHHLLKHHCRGLIGTNSFGTPFLMAEQGSINSLLTVGRSGSQVMMSRAYQEISWDDTDFLANIKVGTMYLLTATWVSFERRSICVDIYRFSLSRSLIYHLNC